MSDWNPNYHRTTTKMSLKTSLWCLIVALTLMGVSIITERVLYNLTFPNSSETVEIDDNTYSIEIYKYNIYLVTNTNTECINATRVWLIPDTNIPLSWKNYEIHHLIFDNTSVYANSASFSPYKTINCDYVSIYNIIVEISATGGRLFYIEYKRDSD